ncbi:hypothetical protein ACSTKY_22895, partial [Vibrio parahaemolyticus]
LARGGRCSWRARVEMDALGKSRARSSRPLMQVPAMWAAEPHECTLLGPVGPKLRFWPSRRTFWERGIRY